MAIIGTFTSSKTGFEGNLETIGLKAKLSIKAIEKSGDKAPDYRVFAGKSEVGAGWKKTGTESKRDYVSLKIDAPIFAAPLFANLVERDGQHDLMWSRSKAE
ncbi:MAG: hypothetical protein QOF14_3731 [Hyphomicrobiales bacterium]|jgi:uncharacterized protein (DUF736 family)|nr:hypothetical protein [Hyphomicrobiales bacterium]